MKDLVKTTLYLILLASSSLYADTMTRNEINTTPNTTVTTTTTIKDNAPIVGDADAKIISGIYSKYGKESALIGTALTVSSQGGVVTLSGSVTQQSQADQAVTVAKSVAGVKDVLSQIIVTTNPGANRQPTPVNY